MKKPTSWAPWVSAREGYLEALENLDKRRKGLTTSFQTPWPKANDAGLEGWEWQTMIVIGGRPGSGKTAIKSQIIRKAFELNSGQNLRVLEFQFEMPAKQNATREFSSVLGKSYKQLGTTPKSKDPTAKPLTDAEMQTLVTYAKERVKYPIDIIQEPLTVEQIELAVINYMEKHSSMEKVAVEIEPGKAELVDKKVYKNTVITLDHSILVKRDREKRESFLDMLYSLGETLTALKRKYPVIFVVLSQLGRQVENPDRAEDGQYSNYILESDLFGGDALFQHADMVIGINRPAKRFIKFFGPERFIIDDESVLVWHFLKVRNGDPRMSFFKARFDIMEVHEMPTPGRKKINTQN